jgi:hypothetical protein
LTLHVYVEFTFLSNWPNFFQNWLNFFVLLAGKQFRGLATLHATPIQDGVDDFALALVASREVR